MTMLPRPFIGRCLLGVACAVALSELATLQESPARGTFAIVRATVIAGTGAPPRRNQTVVVSGGRIIAIGDSSEIPIPAGARPVDATGKFLIPGLWDLHVHTRYEGIDHLRLLLVNGVTSARDMAGPWDHLPRIKKWRDEIARGERLGPRLLTGGPLLDGPGSRWTHAALVRSPDEGRSTVRRLRAEGADFVKVYDLLTRDAFLAIADEARRVGLPFVGHVPNALSLTEASDAGQRSVEHLYAVLDAVSDRDEAMSRSKVEALAIRLKQNGTAVVPTLSNTSTRVGWAKQEALTIQADRLRYIPKAYTTEWMRQQAPSVEVQTRLLDASFQLTRLLHDNGVSLLAGTDVVKPFFVPGFSLHDELGLLVTAGLSEMEAIQAATRDAARFVGASDVGTIELGMVADFLVLDASPLDSIDNTRRIAGVVSTGRLFEREHLQRILAEIRDDATRWSGVPTGR